MGPMPPRSAFVQCGSCNTISDFDLGVARRNPDWARHEAMQHQLYALAKEEFASATRAVVRRGPQGAGCEIWLEGEVITIALDDDADARAVRDAVTTLGWGAELVDPRAPTG